MLTIYIFPHGGVWFRVETQHVSGLMHGFRRLHGTYRIGTLLEMLRNTAEPCRVVLE